MRKAVVRFNEINNRLGTRKRHSKTVSVPDRAFAGWDWDSIVNIFNADVKSSCSYDRDSTFVVTSIKLGRATLLSKSKINLDLRD